MRKLKSETDGAELDKLQEEFKKNLPSKDDIKLEPNQDNYVTTFDNRGNPITGKIVHK